MKAYKVIFFGLFLLVTFFVSATSPSASELLILINQERASYGIDPLFVHLDIETASQLHSEDMLVNGYFSHYSLDGRTPWDRMNEEGFYGTAYAENIAAHSGSVNASEAFDIWLNSPAHYQNMMSPAYNFAGIGIAEGEYDYLGEYSTVYTLGLGYRTAHCESGSVRQCGESDVGVCEYGVDTCVDGEWSGCIGAVYSSLEVCDNSLDDDCNGEVDEFCNCVSHSYTGCYLGNSYWYDSCGRVEDKIEDCLASCEDGICLSCENHSEARCFGSNVYWYDSCGYREDEKESCVDGCVDGACLICEDHVEERCYYNDVYWYNSCGLREEKKEDCVDGCVDGACLICEDHVDWRCYGGNVYWYDSCGVRQDRKEYCLDECVDGECVLPSCEEKTEVCNLVDDDCDGLVDEECVDNLVVISPEKGDEFDLSRVLVELSVVDLDSDVEYLKRGRWYTFCRRTEDCSKVLSLSQGYNQIYFRAIDSSGYVSLDNLTLFVDSKKPKLISQLPRNRKYANGNFSAKYTEDYLEELRLYISTDEEEFEMVSTVYDCPSGRGQECFVDFDLSDFDGQTIWYYLEVADRFNSKSKSPYEVIVDVTDPIINLDSAEKVFSLYYDKYLLDISVSENVLLEYDYEGLVRPKRICSNCDSKEKTLLFRDAPEYVDVIATDFAGNRDIRRVYLE